MCFNGAYFEKWSYILNNQPPTKTLLKTEILGKFDFPLTHGIHELEMNIEDYTQSDPDKNFDTSYFITPSLHIIVGGSLEKHDLDNPVLVWQNLELESPGLLFDGPDVVKTNSGSGILKKEDYTVDGREGSIEIDTLEYTQLIEEPQGTTLKQFSSRSSLLSRGDLNFSSHSITYSEKEYVDIKLSTIETKSTELFSTKNSIRGSASYVTESWGEGDFDGDGLVDSSYFVADEYYSRNGDTIVISTLSSHTYTLSSNNYEDIAFDFGLSFEIKDMNNNLDLFQGRGFDHTLAPIVELA